MAKCHAQRICATHKCVLVSFCPACRGGIRSPKKAAAARENGKLGGRPLKFGPKKFAAKKTGRQAA